jgi:cell division protein FtsB
MKILLTSLAIILLSLQFQLWLGEGSLRSLSLLESELADQQAANADLQARNRLLEIEVVDLKNGLEAVEERARSELGMIGDDEVFYLIIE